MLSRSVSGLALLAALYAVTIPAFAQQAPAAPTPGYYQTQNLRWGVGQGATRGQVMHFSPWSNSLDNPGASTSFFPQAAIKLTDLYEMEFKFYLPYGSSCGGGSPRMVVQVDDGAGGTPTFSVYNHGAVASACSTYAWTKLDFLGAGTTWQSSLPGVTDLASAHAALPAAYRIRVIRINFDGGPHAWFDDERINGTRLSERVQDFSVTALLPDSKQVATPQAPALGHFQSRNVRWGLAPEILTRPASLEAMHYTPYSHTNGPDEDFMSTSFFPQTQMQVRDLYEMGFMLYVPTTSLCGSPFMTLVLANAAGTQERLVEVHTTASGTCVKGAWRNLDFLNDPGTRFNAYQLNGNTHATRTQAHNAAVNALGGSYMVRVIRVGYTGGEEAWVDKERINGLQFSERIQDWSEDALLPDSPLVPPSPVLPLP